MFWSGGRLEKELEHIVAPFDKKKIDCASYTLKIGRQVYISPDGEKSRFAKIMKLHRDEEFEIPSGQFAFILTDEILTIPNNVLAFINTKSRVKLRGLINVSGFHVDPGYHGKIIFSVYNAGPSSIRLKQGADFGLIWFAPTDDDMGKYHKTDSGFFEISTDMVTQVPGTNLSLEVLQNRISSLERKIMISAGVLILPVLGAVTVAILQVIYDKWFG